LNRVDDIIVFHELSQEHLAQIVGIMFQEVVDRIGSNGYHLEITEAAKDLIAREGFDPVFGARPLRRAIQRLVEDQLAEEILAGRFPEGAKVLVDSNEGHMTFKRVEDVTTEQEG
jgi:ATP-dependent Clp protease ATP-binding subunit ClpC